MLHSQECIALGEKLGFLRQGTSFELPCEGKRNTVTRTEPQKEPSRKIDFRASVGISVGSGCVIWGLWSTVDSRKLEHQYPKSLIQKRREIQHQSSFPIEVLDHQGFLFVRGKPGPGAEHQQSTPLRIERSEEFVIVFPRVSPYSRYALLLYYAPKLNVNHSRSSAKLARSKALDKREDSELFILGKRKDKNPRHPNPHFKHDLKRTLAQTPVQEPLKHL